MLPLVTKKKPARPIRPVNFEENFAGPVALEGLVTIPTS